VGRKAWIGFAVIVGGVILLTRPRPKPYIDRELYNLFWDDEAGRWRTSEEVLELIEQNPLLVPIPILSSEAKVLSYLSVIDHYADKQGLDPALIAAIISKESGGDHLARGAVGEYGLMQIRESTAQMFGFSGDPERLYNVTENLNYGTQYVAWQRDRYRGQPMDYAIAAYNAGTAILQRGKFKNQSYVDSVKVRWARYRDLIRRARG